MFVAFAAVQLLVPLWRLGAEPKPVRYGWQMYSRVVMPQLFLVERSTGGVDTIQVRDHSRRIRHEVDLVHHLPPHLCRQTTDAVAVLVKRAGADVHERVECP